MKPFILLLLPLLSLAAAWPSGISGDAQFELSDFAKKTFYRNVKTVSSDMLPSGAYGPNKESELGNGQWFIENQRWGEDAIVAGIVQNDEEAIRRGLKIFDWGFSKQEKDGSFAHRDVFHSSAFFVAAVARAILHLEKSKFAPAFKEKTTEMKAKLKLASLWMIKPEIEKQGMVKDAPMAHRLYLNAAAMGFAGQLLNISALRAQATAYVEKAITLQSMAGFNPEKGGPDTGYQALGLLYAARYFSIEANDDLRKKLLRMGEKGAAWLGSKIGKDGSVDSSGNTRTGDEGEAGRDGKKKSTPYFSIYKSLAYWGSILESEDLKTKAQAVFEYSKSHKN